MLQKVQSRPSISEVLFYTWLVLFLSSYRLHSWDHSDTEWTRCVSSWLGTDDTFLTLGILMTQIYPPASLTTDGSLSSIGFSSTTWSESLPAFGVEEGASCSSNPSVKWLWPIQHGVLHFFFSLKVSFGWREFNGWYCFLFRTCYHEDEVFDATFDFSYLFDNLGVSPDDHEQELPSSLQSLPIDSIDGESSTKCTHRKAPNSLM